MFSCAWSSLFHLLNLHDGLLLRVDGKADAVAGFHALKERRGLNAIAHGHGVHKAFDLLMVHHDLTTIRHDGDHLSLPHDRLLALLLNHLRPMPPMLRHGSMLRHG